MAFGRTDDDEEFKAGIFYGPGFAVPRSGSRRSMAQAAPGTPTAPTAVDQIRQMFSDSLEEGAEKIAQKYSTTGTVIVGALVVTAVATSLIALVMILDR